jgi:hypothetical protein
MNTNIGEILRGCEAGRIQSVGWMQVIPLVSDMHFDNFASPDQAKVSTNHYGTLEFENPVEQDMIIPAHAAYMVKQRAQNHAMTHAGLVGAKKQHSFSTAVCIQETQGGTISAGQHPLVILPFPLREPAHKARNGEGGYSSLWPEIHKLNQRAGLTSGMRGHLELFLDHYAKQLDEFVAEFEPVPDQVGAIVLIGGNIVGIERAPNPEFWLTVWGPLIRECYGSLAILEAKEHSGEPPVPRTRAKVRKANSLDDLREAVNDAEETERKRVSDLVNNVCETSLSVSMDGIAGDRRVETVGDEGTGDCRFLGQVIREREGVAYASLVATDTWRKNADWFETRPFKM